MDTKLPLWWQLLEYVCQLGEFIGAMETKGAEINIVGSLRVAYDGPEYPDTVLERQDCQRNMGCSLVASV